MTFPHIIAVGLTMMASASHAAVFVLPGTEAWWTSKTMVRVMGKQIDGVPVAAINAHLQKTEVTPDEICFAEGLDLAAVIGLTRTTQASIEETFREQGASVFRRGVATPDGRRFVVRSGVYEECDGTTGGLVLVYQEGSDAIEAVSRFEDQPLNYLFAAEKPALVGRGGCFHCGDWSSLFYDVTRRKFYWEYEGD